MLPTPLTCTTYLVTILSLLLIVVVWSYFKKERKERKVFKKQFHDGIDWENTWN